MNARFLTALGIFILVGCPGPEPYGEEERSVPAGLCDALVLVERRQPADDGTEFFEHNVYDRNGLLEYAEVRRPGRAGVDWRRIRYVRTPASIEIRVDSAVDTEPDGETDRSTRYKLDDRGRIERVTYESSGSDVSREYLYIRDAQGEIVASSANGSECTYERDADGRLVTETCDTSTTVYAWDGDRPTSKRVHFGHDHVRGREWEWNPSGTLARRARYVEENGVRVEDSWSRYRYGRCGRLQQREQGSGNDAPTLRTEYTYDENDQVTAITEERLTGTTEDNAREFSWDEEGRLVAASTIRSADDAATYDIHHSYEAFDGGLIRRTGETETRYECRPQAVGAPTQPEVGVEVPFIGNLVLPRPFPCVGEWLYDERPSLPASATPPVVSSRGCFR